jgi:hypothetical protein
MLEHGLQEIDVETKNSWRVGRRHEWQVIGPDSLFPKTTIIAPKKQNKNKLFSKEMQLQLPLLSRGLKLSNSKPGSIVRVFTFLWNGYYQWLSGIELFRRCPFFQLLVPELIHFSLLGKRSRVINCHATCGHRDMPIFISIVYALDTDTMVVDSKCATLPHES